MFQRTAETAMDTVKGRYIRVRNIPTPFTVVFIKRAKQKEIKIWVGIITRFSRIVTKRELQNMRSLKTLSYTLSVKLPFTIKLSIIVDITG